MVLKLITILFFLLPNLFSISWQILSPPEHGLGPSIFQVSSRVFTHG